MSVSCSIDLSDSQSSHLLDERLMASANADDRGPDGSQLAAPNGPQVPGESEPMPDQFLIGTQNDFQNNNAYRYTKKVIGSVTIYLCNKGSEHSRPGEKLLLRKESDGSWIAWDSSLTANKKTILCRQAVFRCWAPNVTKPGGYTWGTNAAASNTNFGYFCEWDMVYFVTAVSSA